MPLTKLTRFFLFATSRPAAELVVPALADELGVLGSDNELARWQVPFK